MFLMVQFGNDWDTLLSEEFEKDYYQNLRQFLIREYKTKTIYPDMYDIFNAFKATPYKDVKIVILGQDPYHQPGQAHGMAFSVKKGVQPPPSLQNMFKELMDDVKIVIPNNGYLLPWAEQGVLLLNTALTVEANKPNSHRNKGWETLTDRAIALLNQREDGIIFMLWGNNAREKKNIITNSIHTILEAPHPSPLSASRGFFGCKHFSKANDILIKQGKTPVNWQLENV